MIGAVFSAALVGMCAMFLMNAINNPESALFPAWVWGFLGGLNLMSVAMWVAAS